MKTIEIEIDGAASEIVVGSLSKEDLNRIHKVMKENDLAEEEGYFDYSHFYYDSSLVSDDYYQTYGKDFHVEINENW